MTNLFFSPIWGKESLCQISELNGFCAGSGTRARGGSGTMWLMIRLGKGRRRGRRARADCWWLLAVTAGITRG